MAFNPFETFSVRSRTGKSVMAVLGIVVMLTFVLSTGAVGSGMDFFDQIGSLFGSKKGRGDVIATAYGDDVRSGELEEARRQRQVASSYLIRAVDASYTEWAKRLDSDVKAGRLTADTKDFVQRFVSLRLKSDTDQRAYQGYLLQFINTQQLGQDVFKLADAWKKAQAKPDSDDKKAMDAVLSILANDIGRLFQQPPVFLVPLGIDSDRDMLDYLLLLKLADRLGIRFSTDGVKDLVARDTGGRLTDRDAAEIEQAIRSGGRAGTVSSEWLAEAIGNEYRAKLALAALEGRPGAAQEFRAMRLQPFRILAIFGVDLSAIQTPGVPATATAVAGGLTPAEFYEFYKDKCGESTFDVLEVRAEALLDRVKEQPTKAELTALFAKYRGELPDPARERPGFKEPKKAKVEYVTVDANAARVTQAIPKVQAASLFLCASGGVLSGSPVAGLVEAAQPSVAETFPVKEAVSRKMEANLSRYTPLEVYDFTPRDTSVYRPRPIVSALGLLAGHPDVTTVMAAAAAVHQQVERIDHQTRIPFLLQSVLTPFNPTFGNALGMPALAYALNPKLPPEGLYLPEAVAATRAEQRRNLFEADVRQLESKLRKLTEGDDNPMAFPPPKRDKAAVEKGREEAKKYLADWLKERGLTPAGTKEPIDQFAVVSNPDLKPLNDLAVIEPDGTNTLSKRLFPEPSGNRFMDTEVKPFEPFWFPGDPAGASLDKPNHLVWVTEETQAVAYNNLDNADRITHGEMSKRVERAWKLEKARALAKAEADAVAERVRTIGKSAAADPGGVERQLRDLAAEKNLREFALERMALLKFQHGATQAQIEYEQPKLDKSQVLYPTPDFLGKLLDLRKEPVGAVTVLPDAPRTRFYVACLVAKTEKTVDQFRDVFDKANASGPARNPLYTQYALPLEQDRAMTDARLRLRADAGLELKEGFEKRERKDTE